MENVQSKQTFLLEQELKETMPHPKRANELLSQLKYVTDLAGMYLDDKRQSDDSSSGSGSELGFDKIFYSISLDELKTFYAVLIKLQAELQAEDDVVADCEGVIDIFNKYAKQYPNLYSLYGLVLKERFRIQSEQARVFIRDARKETLSDRQLKLKAKLDRNTITLASELTAEQKQLLRKSFPSGNFLFHTTSVGHAASIINFGSLMSSSLLYSKIGKSFNRGGDAGISFNMNHVRVLTGNEKHFMGFLVAPEKILDNHTKLIIPLHNAWNEVSFVPKSYQTQKLDGDPLSLPTIPTEKMWLVCPHRDAEEMKYIVSKSGHMLTGVIVYASHELRVESWVEPTGDHIRAGELLRTMLFQNAGLKPSISWRNDLNLLGRSIIKNKGGLQIV